MNIRKVAVLGSLLATASIFGTGCKRYLDQNVNPNVAQNAGPEFLLPSAEIYLASSVGVDLQVNGSIWAQYWTQAPSSSQYKIYEQYAPSSSTYDRVWSLLYSSGLEDLDQMEKKASATNQKLYVAIAKTLKAYTFQVITDGWGDIPFTEALKGQPQDGGITAPHYDPQATVYDGIIQMTKDAIAILNTLPTSQTVTGDLIYNGSVTKWRKFANTLLLKMYLRLSEKNPAKAQAGVAALYAAPHSFIDFGDDAQIVFNSTAGNQNPLYSEIVGLNKVQNLVASKTVLDSMTQGNVGFPTDLRAVALFDPASTGWVGLAQGLYTASPSTPVSIPSAATGANANDVNSALAPVKFMTSYESSFLQAEAAARGWGTGSDEDLFYQGITYSFMTYENLLPIGTVLEDSFANVPMSQTTPVMLTLDYAIFRYINGDTLTGYVDGDPAEAQGPSFWAQYPTGSSAQLRVRHIITQKWFSMTGTQGFEAWTEWRRTGYPDWIRPSANSQYPKTLQYLPHRLLYPDVEVQRNASFPGQKTIFDKVYWDIH